jgi:hypothetical protein
MSAVIFIVEMPEELLRQFQVAGVVVQIGVHGESQDCSLVGFIQTPNGRLAVAFNRHPCHQLGCDSVWGRFPNW